MTERIFALGAGTIALLMAGCHRSEPAGPKGGADTEIVIGVSPFQDTILPKLGEIKGFYAAEHLKVRFRILGWTEVNEALSAPEGRGVDIAINNECGVIAAHERNPEIVYYYGVNPFDSGFALMVRPSRLKQLQDFLTSGRDRAAAIRETAAQLRGKTVITTSNTDMEQGVMAAATKAGLSIGKGPGDVHILNLPPEEGLAAFLRGEGDAYIGGLPQRLAARRAGNIEMLTGADLGPPPVNGFVTTRRFLAQHPDVMPKVLTVWFRIVDYTNHHLPEVSNTVSDMLRSDAGVKLLPLEFAGNWNKIESFIASPDEAQATILSPQGKNYWRSRWDACNAYYRSGTKPVIKKPVDPKGVFLMEEQQPMVAAEYKRAMASLPAR